MNNEKLRAGLSPGGILVLAVLLSFTAAMDAESDVVIQRQSHMDGYTFEGTPYPAKDTTNEIWVTIGKIAYVSPGKTVVVNLAEKELIFVNKIKKTYAETALPLRYDRLLPDSVAAKLKSLELQGEVKATTIEKKVVDKACTMYETKTWVELDGKRYNQTTSKLWVTGDLPFDLEPFLKMRTELYRLSNYSDTYIERLSAIEGYPLVIERTVDVQGKVVAALEKVVTISEMKPPPGLYQPPKGFTKKEKLTFSDLRIE